MFFPPCKLYILCTVQLHALANGIVRVLLGDAYSRMLPQLSRITDKQKERGHTSAKQRQNEDGHIGKDGSQGSTASGGESN